MEESVVCHMDCGIFTVAFQRNVEGDNIRFMLNDVE